MSAFIDRTLTIRRKLADYDAETEASRTFWERVFNTHVSTSDLQYRARVQAAVRYGAALEKERRRQLREKAALNAKLHDMTQQQDELKEAETALLAFKNASVGAPEDALSTHVPRQWSHASSGSTYHLERMSPGSKDVADIKRQFKAATGVGGLGRDQKHAASYSKLEVVDVHRVENRTLWGRHLAARNALVAKSKRHPTACPLLGSRILFHVSSEAAIDSIFANGFTSAFAGEATASAFGRGVYFADDMGKADQYATLNANKLFTAIVSIVDLGCTLAWSQSCKTRNACFSGASERVLRLLPGSNNEFYDSIIMEDPKYRYKEYVLFDAATLGAYPKFKVTYRRV
jgi:hypothetical protein